MFTNPPETLETVGDLIGLAFRSFRQQIGVFIRTLLTPTLIISGGLLSLQWLLNYGLPAKNDSLLNILICVGLIIISLLVTAIGRFVLTLRQLAIVRLSLGYSPDFGAAYRLVKTRVWLILSVLILGSVLSLLTLATAALLLVIVSFVPKVFIMSILFSALASLVIVALCIMMLFIIYFSAYMILTIIVCEDGEFSSLIGRGCSLTWSNLGRCLAFASLLGLCITTVSNPLSLPVVAVSFFEALHKGVTTHDPVRSIYHMPLYVMIVGQLCESIINLLVWPVSFLAFGYFYWDLRLRREGLDILRNTDKLEKQLS